MAEHAKLDDSGAGIGPRCSDRANRRLFVTTLAISALKPRLATSTADESLPKIGVLWVSDASWSSALSTLRPMTLVPRLVTRDGALLWPRTRWCFIGAAMDSIVESMRNTQICLQLRALP